MQGFSDFLDLKIWVQLSETILNRQSFCIHATVNIRNPFPDFLDSKLWVQIPELKTMCSVFWTETIWNRFSGLKIRGRYSEKIQEKNQEGFKFLKLSKIVLKCPNVFWGIFFEKKFSPVFHGSSSLRKISKIQKGPKSFTKLSKLALNMFFFGAFFPKKKFRPVFHGWSSLRKFSKKTKKVSKFQKCQKSFPKESKRVLNMLWGDFSENFLPSVPSRAFQIFWTWKHEFSFTKQYSTDILFAFTPQSIYAIPFQIFWT